MKKILLMIAIVLCIFQMIVLAVDIDIGSEAIDRIASSPSGYTYVDKHNSANASGKILSVEIYAVIAMTDVEVATFFVVDGDNLSTRASAYIGNVAVGYNQFDVNIKVGIGDYIGIYFPVGYIERTSAGLGYWRGNSDCIPCTNTTFLAIADRQISLYGTGTTEEEANAIFFGTNF